MDSFSKSDMKQNNLVLSRVSFDVDWINKIINVPVLSPDVPANFIPTPPLRGNVKICCCIFCECSAQVLLEDDKQLSIRLLNNTVIVV